MWHEIISITVLVLCVSILVMQTDVPIGKRLLGVLFMVLITVPGVVLSLIELTCLVTGGSWKTNWWCWLLAWIIAVIVIVWCVIIIATAFNSILTYTSATKNIKETSVPATEEESNDFAETVLANTESVTNNLYEEMEEEVDPDLELDNVVENDLMMEDPGLEEIDPDLEFEEGLGEEELEEGLGEEELQDANLDLELEETEDVFVNPLEDLDENIEEGFSNCSSKKSHDHLEGFSNCSSRSQDYLESFKNKREYFKKRKLARQRR